MNQKKKRNRNLGNFGKCRDKIIRIYQKSFVYL